MSSTTPGTANPEEPSPPKIRLQTFRALRYRNFRLLWISLIVSSVGTWMQIVAQSLLVLQITHGSALAPGIVALAQASSFFLFALIGGGVADRVDKRRFLLNNAEPIDAARLYTWLSDYHRSCTGMDDRCAGVLLRHSLEL